MTGREIHVSLLEQRFMFTNEKVTKSSGSLFEGKIRPLTGQDEVTNSLVDRVAYYINKPIHLHFAIEQLGLTWEVVSKVYGYPLEDEYHHQQVRCEGNTGRNITRNDQKCVLTIREWALLFR